MTTVVTPLIVGSLFGLALCLFASLLMPAKPDIADTLDRLYNPTAARRLASAAPVAPQTSRERLGAWAQRHVRFLPSTAAFEDLEAVGMTSTALYGTKALLALLGASISVLYATAEALLGQPSIVMPTFLGLACAAGGWVLPDLMVKSRAAVSRERFARTVTSYYDLVTLMRLSGATVPDSITTPAQIGECALFTRIRGTLTRQQLEHKSPWDGLLELAEDINLPELRDLGDLMAMSGARGTPAAAILRAKARDIRSERLNQDIELAQRDLQRSTAAQVLLLAMIMAFLLTPPVLNLITM